MNNALTTLPILFWYLQALLTPFIGVVAVYIAWQQWKANERRSKLDLFDRRFRVYEEVKKVLALMFTTGVNDTQIWDFVTKTEDTVFLFDADISQYREEIRHRANSLSFVRRQLREAMDRNAPPEERSPLAEAEKKEVEWAIAERQTLPDKFKKYLDLSKL